MPIWNLAKGRVEGDASAPGDVLSSPAQHIFPSWPDLAQNPLHFPLFQIQDHAPLALRLP